MDDAGMNRKWIWYNDDTRQDLVLELQKSPDFAFWKNPDSKSVEPVQIAVLLSKRSQY